METRNYDNAFLAYLLERALLGKEEVDKVAAEHYSNGTGLRELLLDSAILSEEQFLSALASYLGIPEMSLEGGRLPEDLVHAIPPSVAKLYQVIPIETNIGSTTLATYDLLSPEQIDEMTFILNDNLSFVVSSKKAVCDFIDQYYSKENDDVEAMLSSLEHAGELPDEIDLSGEDEGIEQAAQAAPVVRFVNMVLYQAVQNRASDIHFEPFEDDFKIRYRVDGALYEMKSPPKLLALPIASRIKVLAGLNISERRLPQDGRIQMTLGGRPIDFRVSTLPTQFGESVVLRVLDQSGVGLDLAQLGIAEDVSAQFQEDIAKPNGIVIVTGPTGSGKTTTLYGALKQLNKETVKILTAEEPVEYDVEGIVQVGVVEKIGLSFSRILRSFLRQDPDIILVGEIRDEETAQISIQASLTGHLVFSTLHTNDAAGAVTRLLDMDIEPFLIAATVEAVMGTRLVRTLCDQCKKAYAPKEDVLNLLGLKREDIGERPFYYGEGCDLCNQTGYRGRKGLYEYLRVNEAIRELIHTRQPTVVIRDKARALGMRTLREDGIRAILDGYTTPEEVLKYT